MNPALKEYLHRPYCPDLLVIWSLREAQGPIVTYVSEEAELLHERFELAARQREGLA